MRKVPIPLTLIPLLLTMPGCQNPPMMPELRNDAVRAAVRECQLIDATCQAGCGNYSGVYFLICKSNCEGKLKTCYSTID